MKPIKCIIQNNTYKLDEDGLPPIKIFGNSNLRNDLKKYYGEDFDKKIVEEKNKINNINNIINDMNNKNNRNIDNDNNIDNEDDINNDYIDNYNNKYNDVNKIVIDNPIQFCVIALDY